MKKTYIAANDLLLDSFQLAANIYKSGFKPDFLVGLWRGGSAVGIAVQEGLDHFGVKTDHIAIRTSSYSGIEQRDRHVRVHGLNYIVKHVNAGDSLLLVDDVFDTGLSIQQVLHDLEEECRKNLPELKVATPYYKPGNNKTNIKPDFYLHETDNWLVFPHELHGLSEEEIRPHKPEVMALREKLASK